jgi:hypothetical protein
MARWFTDNQQIFSDHTLGSVKPLYLCGSHNAHAYELNVVRSLYLLFNKTDVGFYLLLLFLPIIVANLTVNQKLTVYQQLNAGVRYLDLRISKFNGQYYCSHRYICNKLDTILAQINKFVGENPGEFVIINYKPDWENRETIPDANGDGMSELHNYITSRLLSVHKRTVLYEDASRADTVSYIRTSKMSDLFTNDSGRLLVVPYIVTYWHDKDNVADMTLVFDQSSFNFIIDAVVTPSTDSILKNPANTLKTYATQIKNALYKEPKMIANIYAIDYADADFCRFILAKNFA